jgi:hemerythrin superfamily protein
MTKDVVDLIMDDHREVERLFDRMQQDAESRALLLPAVSALLIAHSRAEESEVYPVAREEAHEESEVAHSQEEHAQAEQLLVRLQSIDPLSNAFDTTLDELVDAVTHHVEEEESSVLPGLRSQLTAERGQQLASAFTESRASHFGDRPGEATKEELVTAARNEGITGASNMSKQDLLEQIQPEDDS